MKADYLTVAVKRAGLRTTQLIRTLKEEEVHLTDYQDITEARQRIGHFITHVYYHKRPHSALGYLTPLEFQRQTLS